MSGCSRVVNLLVDYLEGRLSPETQASLDQHLSRCPACLAQLHTYRWTVTMLHSIAEHELAPELRDSLRSFLEGRVRH